VENLTVRSYKIWTIIYESWKGREGKIRRKEKKWVYIIKEVKVLRGPLSERVSLYV
jgi:hypothetical protein